MNYTVTYLANGVPQEQDVLGIVTFRIIDGALLAFNDGEHDILVIPLGALVSIKEVN